MLNIKKIVGLKQLQVISKATKQGELVWDVETDEGVTSATACLGNTLLILRDLAQFQIRLSFLFSVAPQAMVDGNSFSESLEAKKEFFENLVPAILANGSSVERKAFDQFAKDLQRLEERLPSE